MDDISLASWVIAISIALGCMYIANALTQVANAILRLVEAVYKVSK